MKKDLINKILFACKDYEAEGQKLLWKTGSLKLGRILNVDDEFIYIEDKHYSTGYYKQKLQDFNKYMQLSVYWIR